MKNIAYTLTALVLPISTAVAAPSFSRRQDVCGLASSVQVTAYGAAGADSSFSVLFDNLWHDIDGTGYNKMLSISSVTWPGFPTVNCEFQGATDGPVLNNGIIDDSGVTFVVAPPQPLVMARCSCEN